MNKLVLLVMLISTSSCGLHYVGVDEESLQQGLYETFQSDMSRCFKHPDYQQADCKQKAKEQLSYEAYKKARRDTVD